MRTTLTLDEDVAEKTKVLAAKLHKPFKKVINEAIRLGLAQVEKPGKRRPYRTDAHELGLRPGYDLDNTQELLARIEGDVSR